MDWWIDNEVYSLLKEPPPLTLLYPPRRGTIPHVEVDPKLTAPELDQAEASMLKVRESVSVKSVRLLP